MPRRTRAGAHDWAAEGHGWVWRGRSLRRVAYFASVDPEAGLEASREGELGDTSGRGEIEPYINAITRPLVCPLVFPALGSLLVAVACQV